MALATAKLIVRACNASDTSFQPCNKATRLYTKVIDLPARLATSFSVMPGICSHSAYITARSKSVGCSRIVFSPAIISASEVAGSQNTLHCTASRKIARQASRRRCPAATRYRPPEFSCATSLTSDGSGMAMRSPLRMGITQRFWSKPLRRMLSINSCIASSSIECRIGFAGSSSKVNGTRRMMDVCRSINVCGMAGADAGICSVCAIFIFLVGKEFIEDCGDGLTRHDNVFINLRNPQHSMRVIHDDMVAGEKLHFGANVGRNCDPVGVAPAMVQTVVK